MVESAAAVRLPVLCARLNICSRSEAVRYVKLGLVEVNGKTVQNAASLVPLSAQVRLKERGQRMQREKITVALNKPLHYAACRAPTGTPLARALLVPENRALTCRTKHDPRKLSNLWATDALDVLTDGLLLFSQDGRITTRITRSKDVEKEYRILLPGGASSGQLAALRATLEAEAAATPSTSDRGPPSFDLTNNPEDFDVDADEAAGEEAATLHCEDLGEFLGSEDGSEPQGLLMKVVVRGPLPDTRLRRACQLAGLPGAMLTRTRIGPIELGRLPVGQWSVVKTAELIE